jgi:hypothetical protein
MCAPSYFSILSTRVRAVFRNLVDVGAVHHGKPGSQQE